MEHAPRPPERPNPLLEQAELESLFHALAKRLITKGQHEPNRGAYTPEGRPEALLFRLAVDPWLIKATFYPEDDTIEVIGGVEDTYFTYSTPHALGKEEIELQASNVYLEFPARLRGSDVTFQESYRVAVGEAMSDDIYTGSVEREYERAGQLIGEELVEIHGTLLMLTSEYRDIRRNDAARLRRLLEHL
jgi:hypothetical protein